jgi:hypothetical protein
MPRRPGGPRFPEPYVARRLLLTTAYSEPLPGGQTIRTRSITRTPRAMRWAHCWSGLFAVPPSVLPELQLAIAKALNCRIEYAGIKVHAPGG